MKTLLKSAMSFFALIVSNSLSFASDKTPEVYVSKAPLSNLSGSELLHTSWFWVMIGVCLVVGLIALLSTKDEEQTSHTPKHAL